MEKKSTQVIPDEYRKSGKRQIKTVGQLIAHLSKLPKTLPMNTGFSDALDVYVVLHIKGSRERLECCVAEFENY